MNNRRNTAIQADAMLFSDLFHQGQFAVPWHQRYYDWKKRDVRALLQDIDDAIADNRRCYFLGAIMLVSDGDRKWAINDGQQRMVTVSLICAALCRRFARKTRDSQREGHALRMLFDLDDKSVWKMGEVERYTPRIVPPDNDAMRYRQMIRGNTIGTNGMLTAAWLEIEDFLSPMTPEKWQHYFDFIREKLEIACLWIPQQVDPNAVYETINCRGKSLEDFDLIRNFIYSHFNSDNELERKSSVHANLERIRLAIPNSQKASEYVRCHLQCRYGFLQKENFYRDVRNAIQTQRDDRRGTATDPRDYAFALTQQIASPESVELFRTMTATTPDPDFVGAFETDSGTAQSLRHLSVFLRELNIYTVSHPLVFALLTWYVREDDGRKRKRVANLVNRNLSRLSTFVMRAAFVAPKFEPSHFETEFSNCARNILASDQLVDREFVQFLQECDRAEHGVLDDARFRDAMLGASMTGNPRIRQFLLGINRLQQPDARLLNESRCTVEHILPKSPQHWGAWTGFEDGADWINKVGNLTLMSSADNKSGTKYNSSFAKKRDSYADSSVAITRELKKHADWTSAEIESRQQNMVEQAIRVWAFS